MFLSQCFCLLAAFFTFARCDTFTNPLKDPNGSDPFMVYTGGYYYLLTTTWKDVEITRATTLEGLKTGDTQVVWTDTTASRSSNVWAPEVHYLDDAWYLYYTAGDAADLDEQRIHVLKGGATPFDTYTYAAQLTPYWGIDGTVLRFTDANYFVWSCQSGGLQSLCIATLTSPTTIGAFSVISQPTSSWETVGEPVNEGPAALYYGGNTYLTYSADYCWTASYSLGLLTWNGGDPLEAASWDKAGPVLTSANGNYGTGHNGFFTSPDGTETWIVYHATDVETGNCAGDRYTMAQPMSLNTADNTPHFGTPRALGTVITGPSGE